LIKFGQNQNLSSPKTFDLLRLLRILDYFLLLTIIRYLLIYLSRYLDQETTKGPFRPSSQAATWYYQS